MEGVSERWRGVRGGGGVWYAGYLCGRRGGGWKVVVSGARRGIPERTKGRRVGGRGYEGWRGWGNFGRGWRR